MIFNITNLKLNQLLNEARSRFKILKINLEKIKLKIDSGDNIMVINPDTGVKIESIEELDNEFIIIFKGSKLLINPKTIINLN
jgi:hypothetical protein